MEKSLAFTVGQLRLYLQKNPAPEVDEEVVIARATHMTESSGEPMLTAICAEELLEDPDRAAEFLELAGSDPEYLRIGFKEMGVPPD